LAQAIKRLHMRCKIPNALQHHIQLPNSFITYSFKQRISPQFLSVLNMELEGAMRDSDKNSHEEKFKKLLEANEFNPIQLQ